MYAPIKIWLPYKHTSPTIIGDIVLILNRTISSNMVMRVHNLTKEELSATIFANTQAIYWMVVKCNTNHTGNCGSNSVEFGSLNIFPFEGGMNRSELVLEANNDSGDTRYLYSVEPDLTFFAGLSS